MPELLVKIRTAKDAGGSARRIDENGFLHVLDNPVTKEQIAEYYGNEIPDWQEMKLDPDKLYRMYRPAAELEKAVATIHRLPIELQHNDTDAENLPKDKIIGSMGSDARFDGTYLRVSLCFTDGEAVRRIQMDGGGALKELSLCYFYKPDMTPGEWKGQPYDGIITNMRGNHLALVDEGRAGPDVAVRDAKPPKKESYQMANKKKVGVSASVMGKILSLLSGGGKANDAEPGEQEKAAAALAAEIVDDIAADNDTVADNDTTAQDNALDSIKALLAGDLDDEKKAQLIALVEQLAAGGNAATPDSDTVSDSDGEGEKAKDNEGEKAKDADTPPDMTDEQKAWFEKGMAAAAAKAVETAGKAADSAAARSAERLQALLSAQQEVKPYLGNVQVSFAKDSAETLYKRALEQNGISTAGVPAAAYKPMFEMMRNREAAGMVTPARDSAGGVESDDFEFINTLRVPLR